MALVHDVDDLWFIIYEGFLYTRDLEQLVCGRCEADVKAYVDGHWITRACRCSVICIMLCPR